MSYRFANMLVGLNPPVRQVRQIISAAVVGFLLTSCTVTKTVPVGVDQIGGNQGDHQWRIETSSGPVYRAEIYTITDSTFVIHKGWRVKTISGVFDLTQEFESIPEHELPIAIELGEISGLERIEVSYAKSKTTTVVVAVVALFVAALVILDSHLGDGYTN